MTATMTAKAEIVPIDSVHQDPANLRRHPERNLDAIKASLARFGQVKPIVVDAKGIIRAGNGTHAAARALGWAEIAVVRTDLAGPEAIAYSITDNRTTDLSTWDDTALAETLRSLQSEDFPIEAAGFTDGEVDDLIAGLADESIGLAGDEEGDGADGTDDDDSGPAEPLVFPNEAIIEAAFRWFRATGFPYRNLPVHVCMQEINRLAAADCEKLIATNTGYYVADTYHPHRIAAHADGMLSPLEAFADDALLRRAIRLKVECGRNVGDDCLDTIPVVSGTQACANFRPGFACKLYRDYCKSGATVLDTSTGYGGRLVGFMASGMAGRYIGIDPNESTHEGNLRMAAELGFADRVELHNLPAEDVPHDVVAGRCDFAFTSPPYFRKEHYSDAPTQSWVRYRTGEDWRDGFLAPMLALQFAALRPGCHAIVNIADVTIKNRTYPLADWTRVAGKAAGFEYVRTDEYVMRKEKRFGAGHDDEVATEPVIVFRKPAQTSNGSIASEPTSSNRSTR